MFSKRRIYSLKKLFVLLLKNVDFSNVISGSAQPQITRTNLKNFQIPLPPLEKQQEIVDEIEQYQKVIDGARQVVENYEPSVIPNSDWESLEIEDIGEVISGGTQKQLRKHFGEEM